MLELTKENFEKEVLKSKKLVLVDFKADWCAPCKLITPALQDLSKEFKNIKFTSMDVDQYSDIATNYGVRAIPNILIFENGNIKDRVVGLESKEHLKQWLKNI